MTDTTRCLGTTSPECQSCARRIERAEATELTWWMVPPIARPCAERVEREGRLLKVIEVEVQE